MSALDQTFECVDCHESFVWTVGEQEYYSRKGLQPPKRCGVCRATRRQQREEAALAIGVHAADADSRIRG